MLKSYYHIKKSIIFVYNKFKNKEKMKRILKNWMVIEGKETTTFMDIFNVTLIVDKSGKYIDGNLKDSEETQKLVNKLIKANNK